MIVAMRRLHERGHDGRGLVVDGDGAMLGPDYVLRFVETTWWLADNLPRIQSYLAEPKTLEKLQDAVSLARPGYEIHHIVERQSGSRGPSANSQCSKTGWTLA